MPVEIEENAPVADSATVARAGGSQSNDVATHRVGYHLSESGAKTFLVGSWRADEPFGRAS
jgi:hypothetical protein